MTGRLRQNETGRWEYGGRELTCGDLVEVQLGGQWCRGRIEHSPRPGYFFFLPAGEAQAVGVLHDRDGAVVLLHEGMPARSPAQRRVWL
jgi:hypothetical protein